MLPVRFFGFRPKFKNDDRQTEVTHKFDALAGFVKLSGYLSHLLTWIESDGTPCWTAFSKNSGDSTLTLEEAEAQNKKGGFANDAASIWQPYITTRLIIDMEKTYTHVCAETLSKNPPALFRTMGRLPADYNTCSQLEQLLRILLQLCLANR